MSVNNYIVYSLDHNGVELCILFRETSSIYIYPTYSQHKVLKRISTKLCIQLTKTKMRDMRFYNDEIYEDSSDFSRVTTDIVSELFELKDIDKVNEKLKYLENTIIFYCYYA